jgi:hypothetical protein
MVDPARAAAANSRSRAPPPSGELVDQFLHLRRADRVCVVIVTLFIEILSDQSQVACERIIHCAMIALICELSSFHEEVYLATRTVRIDVARFGG